MEQERLIKNTMEKIIETSTEIRDFLLDKNVSLEEKMQNIKVVITALEANKNLVSTANVIINVEKLTNGIK